MNLIVDQRLILHRVTRFISIIGFSGLVAIGLLIMVDALARHLFLPRVPGLGDLGEVFYALVIASCFPAGLLHSQNVRVSLLGDALGQSWRRWFDVFGAAVTLIVFALMAYQFFVLTADIQMSGRVTRTILMPVAPWWWFTAAILVMTVPVQIWVLVARVAEAITGQVIVNAVPLAMTDQLLDSAIGGDGEQSGGQGD